MKFAPAFRPKMISHIHAPAAVTAATPIIVNRRAPISRRYATQVWRVLLLLLLSAAPFTVRAATERIVVVKIDGLPPALVERYVRERDARGGKSRLPWIEHIFFQRGTRLANFYVRGMSLSAPSWSLLDTGRHLQIKGNVEYDRFTLRSYDYLNFIPFYIATAFEVRVDMPGPEVLDDLRIPLVSDAFAYESRYPSFQLFQRGVRWTTLQNALVNRVTSRSPRETFDEFTIGFDTRSIVNEQQERELIRKLHDPTIRYLDYYTTEFDHVAHGNPDALAQLHVMQEIDALVGRLWTAIQTSPLGDETAFVMVSDHGINSAPGIYSQGYNLVNLLGSPEGGGHHVITKRRLLLDYSLKGAYPFVPLITSTSEHSPYLKGQSTDYPTALLDFDGNERASIHLRDGDLNELHILFQQLQKGKLDSTLEVAVTEAFFARIERNRSVWGETLRGLTGELEALRREIARREALQLKDKPKWTREQLRAGVNKDLVRANAALRRLIFDERLYTEYARTLANLLELDRANFDPAKIKIADFIPRNSMGESNTLHELQNYTVGLSQRGLTLKADNTLDDAASFRRVNYFELIGSQRVRNTIQRGVGNRPVDFVGVRIPDAAWNRSASERRDMGDVNAETIVWLYGGAYRQALVLGRHNANGDLELRYLPVQELEQDTDGRIRFRRAPWIEGLPLKLWEDARLRVPAGAVKEAWLDGWHTDTEWLRATHETFYSNAIVGVHEQFAEHPLDALDPEAPGISSDERLMRRLRQRQRRLVETDLFVHASDHWNFDVRGFNPGGNHGSFYRISTHSTLMFAGGVHTGIKQAHIITEPYDSLSYVPTLLALSGQNAQGRIVPVAWRGRFDSLPGRIIGDLLNPMLQPRAGATTEAGGAP